MMSGNIEPTPLMRQYWEIKNQYSDALLFFRLGDFYELFDSDAETAALELDITHTGRQDPSYKNGRVPMAGVPVRSAELYLAKLLDKGYSIAICEQVGTPGAGSGPMERKITRVLTPGTVLEPDLLAERQNNFLVAIAGAPPNLKSSNQHDKAAAGIERRWGLSYVDASCGEFCVTELNESELILEIARLVPKELLVGKKVIPPMPGQPLPTEIADVPAGLDNDIRVVARPPMFFQFEPARRRIFSIR